MRVLFNYLLLFSVQIVTAQITRTTIREFTHSDGDSTLTSIKYSVTDATPDTTTIYEVDESDKVLEITTKIYENGKLNLSLNQHSTHSYTSQEYSYNSDGKLHEIIIVNSFNGNESPTQKGEFLYFPGYDSLTMFDWRNEEWTATSSSKTSYFENIEDRIIYYETGLKSRRKTILVDSTIYGESYLFTNSIWELNGEDKTYTDTISGIRYTEIRIYQSGDSTYSLITRRRSEDGHQIRTTRFIRNSLDEEWRIINSTLTEYEGLDNWEGYFEEEEIEEEPETILSAQSEILVYPNPVDNILFIRNNRSSDLLLTDQSGRRITIITNNNTDHFLDLSGLPSGIYFLKYGDSTVKFIKK